MPETGPGKYLSNAAILNKQTYSFSKDKRGRSASVFITPGPYKTEIGTLNSKYKSSTKMGKFS